MSAAGADRHALLPTAGGREVRRVVAELLRPRRRRAAVAVLVLVAAAGAGLLGPLLLGEIVDRVTSGQGPAAITAPGVALLGVAVAEAALSAVGLALVAGLGQPMLADLRERVVERALRLPAEDVERSGRGDLLSRVGDDVAAVAEAVVSALPALAGASVTIGLTFAGLAAIDPRLALAGLCSVPLQAYALRWYLPRARPAYMDERVAAGARAQALLEAVGGARTIRALGLADRELPRVAARSTASVDAVIHATPDLDGLLHAAELGRAGRHRGGARGRLPPRPLRHALGRRRDRRRAPLRAPVRPVQHRARHDRRGPARAGGARPARRRRHDPAAPEPPAAAPPAGAAVALRGIRHAYAAGHDVLHGVDLELAEGERVALVGRSGAGKTTLAKVLAGFHVPTEGAVTIGGVPLAATRRAVALVTQELHVFAGPLASDLRLAAPAATDAELDAALELVGARAWVDALRRAGDTVTGAGGVALTAAQSQQLALARLALADPRVAVLDEATAEAGSAGARVLEAAADRVLAGRTALVVAHRLSQAARADRVVFLEDGRVVEQGTHAALSPRAGPTRRSGAALVRGARGSVLLEDPVAGPQPVARGLDVPARQPALAAQDVAHVARDAGLRRAPDLARAGGQLDRPQRVGEVAARRRRAPSRWTQRTSAPAQVVLLVGAGHLDHGEHALLRRRRLEDRGDRRQRGLVAAQQQPVRVVARRVVDARPGVADRAADRRRLRAGARRPARVVQDDVDVDLPRRRVVAAHGVVAPLLLRGARREVQPCSGSTTSSPRSGNSSVRISPGCWIGQPAPKSSQASVTRIMRGVSARRRTSVARPARAGNRRSEDT